MSKKTIRVRALMHIPARDGRSAKKRGDVFDATLQEWRDWEGVKAEEVKPDASAPKAKS